MSLKNYMVRRIIGYGVWTISIIVWIAGHVETSTAQEQRVDTFRVTVQEKTPAHPYYGKESVRGYAIDGVEGKEITIQRLVPSVFIMIDVPEDLAFFFFEDQTSQHDWYTGVVPLDIAFNNDTVVFTPPEHTPDTLYYMSVDEGYAGGRILVVDSITSGVEDQNHNYLSERIHSAHAAPNPFHSSTEISFDLKSSSSVAMEIVDVVGRVVYSSEGEWMEAGRRTVTVRGENLPSGVLLYRITALAGERRKIYTGRIVRE